MRPAAVVAGWGAANAVLTGVLVGFGGSPIPMIVYGSAVVLIELVAAAVLLTMNRGGAERAWSLPADTGTPALIAAAALVAALGLAFDWWISLISATLFALAALNATVVARKSRA
jgi:uncharacterized membrane protein YdbT with pleckstrin-like domain